jgi:hypothetical protein
MDIEGSGSQGLANVLLIILMALFWRAHQREIRGTLPSWGFGMH